MDSPITVNCDFCNTPSLIPKSSHGVVCSSKDCAEGMVFRPIGNDKKYIRVICKNKPSYYWMAGDAKEIVCKCCSALYDITNHIVEIRNNQKIYSSKRRTDEDEPKKDSSATDACKDLLKKNEADLAELKKKNLELQAKFQVHQEAKNMEIEAIKRELGKDVAELKNQLKEMEKEKDDALEKLRSRIPNEDIVAEMKKDLETIRTERDQLINDKTKMEEQISSLIAANLNWSMAVAKMAAEPAKKIEVNEEEKEVKEEAPTSCGTEDKPEDPQLVPCDICGVKARIPKGRSMTNCKEPSCTAVVLGRIKEGYRVVRWICGTTAGTYCVVRNSKTTVTCGCCQKEFIIKDIIIESRNNVNVYWAVPTTKPEDEIAELRNKLKNCEEKLEAEKKTMEEEVKKALSQTDDVEKVYLEQLKKTEEQNKKLLDELEIVRKKKDEKENNSVHLTEINKLLMKKLAEKGAAQ